MPEAAAQRGLFSGIYEAELGYVCQSLRRLGVASADLEDLAHEIFLTAYRSLDRFESGRPLRPWLFGIAARTVANYKRLARHTREVGGDDAPAADGGLDPEGALSARQDHELVLKALDALDFDRRTVFVMYELNGHAMADIAEGLSVSVNTLYSRLRLARAEFVAAVRRLKAASERPEVPR